MCWHSTISLLVSRVDGRLQYNFPPSPSVFMTFTCHNQQSFPSLPLSQNRQMSSERSEKCCFILTNVAALNRIVGINSNCREKKKITIFSVKGRTCIRDSHVQESSSGLQSQSPPSPSCNTQASLGQVEYQTPSSALESGN